MATTTTPEVQPKTTPVNLTPTAIAKVKEIMAAQNPVPAGLRLSVVGGGCSGFQYSMAFENGAGLMDKVFDMDGAGFKFENPNVKSTCGCGSSFQA